MNEPQKWDESGSKSLLEQVFATEKNEHEARIKFLVSCVSTIESGEDRARITSEIERSLNIDNINAKFQKLLTLFPDNKIISIDTPEIMRHWLIKQIRGFPITVIIQSLPELQHPSPKQARDKLQEVIEVGELFLKKVEEFHPYGWPRMAWRNPETDKPAISDKDINEWSYFLMDSHPLRLFLQKTKKNQEIIASRVKKKRGDKDAKETLWQKLWGYYEELTGEQPTQANCNYYNLKVKSAPVDLYDSKFMDMIEILLPGVFTKKELNAFYMRRDKIIYHK